MSWATPFDGAARQLLHDVSGENGIHASRTDTTNYRAIFCRDAVMAGVAGLLLDDATITAAFARTLEHLRVLQGAEGQIASNYLLRANEPPVISFGTLAPRLDAATWYLVGTAIAARANLLDADLFRNSVDRTARLLDAIEYNGRHLLYIPMGGNWADEYTYDGYILYDQVLRAWGLRLCADVFDRPEWRDKATAISQTIASRFASTRGHPYAALSPTGPNDTFDLAACSLLGAARLAPDLAGPTLEWIISRFVDRGSLPPAFDPVIDEGHPGWAQLRRYHLHEFRNLPHEYHNGGVWPIWTGWLALALGVSGQENNLRALRDLVRRWLDRHPFQFEEFWHGVSGRPGGTPHMAYSATGLVMLRFAGTPRASGILG